VRDHQKDVNDFRRESTSAKNDQVKQFAESTLPTLQDHLKQAEQTAQTVGATTAATTGTTSARRRARGTSGTSSGARSGGK
jgi:putative membrane protein